MDKERFKALCALYFFNTIQPDELKELKSALRSGDAELQKIFYQTKKSMVNFPLSIDLIEPTEEPKQRLTNNTGKKKRKAYQGISLKSSLQLKEVKFSIAAAVSVLLFLSLIILSFYLSGLMHEEKQLKYDLNGADSRLEYYSEIFDVLNSKQIEVINLTGQDINPNGYGKIFWSPNNNKAVLQVSNLPPLNENQDYQLWLDKNGDYSSEGVIHVMKSGGDNLFLVSSLPINDDNVSYSLLVTLEKKGGAQKPSGPLYLRGIINSQ